MAKIFFFIFNFSILLYGDSISKAELYTLKKNSFACYENKDYPNCTESFRKLIEYSSEPKLKLYLAISLFNSNNLEIPEKSDDIFIRNEKIKLIRNHYLEISNLLSDYLSFVEERKFKEPNISEYYFLLAISKYYSGNKKQAVYYFQKIRLDKKYSEKIRYNIALIEAE